MAGGIVNRSHWNECALKRDKNIKNNVNVMKTTAQKLPKSRFGCEKGIKERSYAKRLERLEPQEMKRM